MGSGTNPLDASAFVDPNTCAANTLEFRWVVTFMQGQDVFTPFTDRGITGYVTPTLTIGKDAMPRGPARSSCG